MRFYCFPCNAVLCLNTAVFHFLKLYFVTKITFFFSFSMGQINNFNFLAG